MPGRHRLSSRILLFDEGGRILLMLTTGDNGGSRWLTPGGGLDAGEEHLAGAVRELYEETGLTGVELAGPVFDYDFDATFGALDHDTGHAEYFVATVPRFVPIADAWTPEEHIDILGHRWWSLDELSRTTEPYEPPMLLDLIRTHAPKGSA